MKNALTIVLILGSLNTFSQNGKTDSVSFCEKLFPIPSSCGTPSRFQIFCDDYSMYWFYPAKAVLSLTFNLTVDGMVKGFGDSCRKDSVAVFLLNQRIPTIKLTYTVNGAPFYELISCGLVNDQAVINILNLSKNPKINEDLPMPIRQIVKLK